MSVDQCQAQPLAGRSARDDLLCASAAHVVVLHRGVEMPVCRIHGKAFERWGVDAEWKAAYLWDWASESALIDSTALADLLPSHH
jgi:hypothetical protein